MKKIQGNNQLSKENFEKSYNFCYDNNKKTTTLTWKQPITSFLYFSKLAGNGFHVLQR